MRPSVSIVSMVGEAFIELGMLDKYHKLHAKYPPPEWEYRYSRGRRIKVKVQAPSKQINTYTERLENVEQDSDLNKNYESSEETSGIIDDQQVTHDNDVTIYTKPEQISDITERIDDEQLRQEADVTSNELEQISENSNHSMETILDV